VVHPGTFFQVLDGELYSGVVPVEGVEFDSSAVQVGEEAKVPPVGQSFSWLRRAGCGAR